MLENVHIYHIISDKHYQYCFFFIVYTYIIHDQKILSYTIHTNIINILDNFKKSYINYLANFYFKLI